MYFEINNITNAINNLSFFLYFLSLGLTVKKRKIPNHQKSSKIDSKNCRKRGQIDTPIYMYI